MLAGGWATNSCKMNWLSFVYLFIFASPPVFIYISNSEKADVRRLQSHPGTRRMGLDVSYPLSIKESSGHRVQSCRRAAVGSAARRDRPWSSSKNSRWGSFMPKGTLPLRAMVQKMFTHYGSSPGSFNRLPARRRGTRLDSPWEDLKTKKKHWCLCRMGAGQTCISWTVHNVNSTSFLCKRYNSVRVHPPTPKSDIKVIVCRSFGV